MYRPVLKQCGLEKVVVHDHWYGFHWYSSGFLPVDAALSTLWSLLEDFDVNNSCLNKRCSQSWSQTGLLYIIHDSVHHLGDFLCCLLEGAVFFPDSKFFLLFFSGTFWWLCTSASPVPIVACSEEIIRSSLVISDKPSGTLVFLWTTLVWGWSNLFETFCSSLAWDDWMGQGRTSQSKCMWAGTWARAWVWDAEEPEATASRKGGLGHGSKSL